MTEKMPHSPVRFLRNEQSFWVAATIIFCAVSVLKGFRAPNLWAATQAQFDYSQGFVKRGLFGATVTRVFHLNHYHRFAVFSTVLLFVFLLLVFLLARSAKMSKRLGSAQPAAVFAASYAVVFLVHLNGYLDSVLGILTVCILSVRKARSRLLLAIPTIVLALLVHELFLLVFLPLILLSFILEAWAEGTPGKRRRVLFATVFMALIALGVTVRLALRAPLPANSVAEIYRDKQASADFPLQIGVFDVLMASTAGNLHVMRSMATTGYWRKQEATGILLYLPFAVFTLYLMFRLLSAHSRSGRYVIFACCLVASMCPLLMNLFGWDIGRWYALTGLTTFLVLCTLCRSMPETSLQMTPALQRAGWLVIALGMASGGMMMDKRVITPYPFITTGLGQAWSMPAPSHL